MSSIDLDDDTWLHHILPCLNIPQLRVMSATSRYFHWMICSPTGDALWIQLHLLPSYRRSDAAVLSLLDPMKHLAEPLSRISLRIEQALRFVTRTDLVQWQIHGEPGLPDWDITCKYQVDATSGLSFPAVWNVDGDSHSTSVNSMQVTMWPGTAVTDPRPRSHMLSIEYSFEYDESWEGEPVTSCDASHLFVGRLSVPEPSCMIALHGDDIFGMHFALFRPEDAHVAIPLLEAYYNCPDPRLRYDRKRQARPLAVLHGTI
eukprot:TRINITY_DN13008_c0_g1_i1.p1 TRINITY_DN13008_c0_g1~~TRINITY_DN13008_c0_g1_i1.p1  ORF type:complete len:260 (-),score=21.55 TRINITY_DN13008_c0_g1_i1:18-797(-)